jgi:hypothetical protein
MDCAPERRWIVLTEDGRFVTLGRASDPTKEELAAAEAAMRAQGTAGWLALMEGSPYVAALPTFLEVRPLADPAGTFAEAVDAFRARTAASAPGCLGNFETRLVHPAAKDG